MKPRVMLVEDSPTQALRIRTLLEDDGLEVVHFETAEAALEHLRKTAPGVIVLDLHLPGMQGDAFCREIRMNVNTRAIPVLMLTIEGSDAAQLHGLESGADDYLSKSADPDILRVRVQALLRKSQGAAPILDVEDRFARARVLAIDDSPTYIAYLAYELRAEQYVVETATSPGEGLDRVAREQFECIVVDFEMPRINGDEVCRRIRNMTEGSDRRPVIVMLTSHEDKEHMTLGFDAGVDDYIAKSADIAVIKARIRALLRRKFLVEENRHILNELREKELQAIRAESERKAAELRAEMADQLAKANRKLDLANQELEHFAYAAAHDLQEPLRMIAVYTQLLKTRYGPSLDDTGRQCLDFCVEGGQRMSRLINDLLMYARASQAAAPDAEPVELDAVVEQALANLQGAIAETGAEVVHDPLPAMRVEEVRMQQVIQNLIGNALKYRRPGAPPRVRVSARQTGDDWLFTVEDNGIGIAAADQKRIFQAFNRAHKAKASGTGLGLAICQRVVEGYGGRIWVESEPGRGSKFFFSLPARLAAPEPSLVDRRA